MDGSTVEQSDSDSGESWTLLEHSPSFADSAPEFANNPLKDERNVADTNEKDEDTDGISIISESDPESTTPCELSYETYSPEPEFENRPTEQSIPECVSTNPLPPENNITHEPIRSEDDFLGSNTGKLKTYVHRRNKRLSTVLNIIMLGSVITAAGVAIGHMWGARDDCSLHTTPSVNKILSNLYKLQEENAYLRNKLKELTLMNNIQLHRRTDTEKSTMKQHRCRKVFEESLNNKNSDGLTKCVDSDNNNEKVIYSHSAESEYEKEFANDMDKLKNIYKQNKSWLDEEITKRIKNEKKLMKKIKDTLQSTKFINVHDQPLKSEKVNEEVKQTSESPVHTETIINVTEPPTEETLLELEGHETSSEKKIITYADSLKSDKDHQNNKRYKRESDNGEDQIKEYTRKKKFKKEYDNISENSVSDSDLKKDDRYIRPKHKQDRKKHDRQKLYKKQKRRNKYEQWEMKGGYMKDYDDSSIKSSQENEFVLNADKNIQSQDFERNNYIDQFSETDDNRKYNEMTENKVKYSPKRKGNEKGDKEKELTWYEKRAAFRTQARKKLEEELFGETSANNAGWYFRRMQKREQCRAKGDNSTYRKLSKRNMNFKMKH